MSNIIDSKKEIDCPRDADGHKLSSHELYYLSKIDSNHSYLKKLGLNGGSMLKKATVCKKRKNKINSKRWKAREQIHRKCKEKITTAPKKPVQKDLGTFLNF